MQLRVCSSTVAKRTSSLSLLFRCCFIYMGPLLLVLLAAQLLPDARAVPEHSLDVTTVYRFHHTFLHHDSSDISQISKEVHVRTNALGRILRAANGSYLAPVGGLPELNCITAMNECSWTKIGTWINVNLNMLDLDPITAIKLGNVSSCAINKGGCQVKCTISGGSVSCSCPPGYALGTDRRTCTSAAYNKYVISGTTGTFSSPNHPSSYSNGQQAAWLLVAPEHYKIKLSFSTFQTESGYDWVEVYDGSTTSDTKLLRVSGSAIPNTVISSSNIMYVTFQSDGSNVYHGFAAIYVTEVQGTPTLSLSSNEGSLKSVPVIPENPGLCLSIIYKMASANSNLWVSAQMTDMRIINLTVSHTSQVGNFMIKRFKKDMLPENDGQALTLTIHVTGSGSNICAIMSCNAQDDEDVYISMPAVPRNMVPKPVTSRETYSENNQKCYNGGVLLTETNKCLCPAGFTGVQCEEGCGANRFGHDCEGICSAFEQGCKKMIFCRDNLTCLCAPGFTGEFCDNYCEYGYYGASCRQPCGHCAGDCNIFTGECLDGCTSGFYPPLCQDTYSLLATNPHIVTRDFTSALVSANLEVVNGKGSARFYQIQYKEKESDKWKELQHEKALTSAISSNITGLKSGVHYTLQIVLIDSDGNSYQGYEVPKVNFQTICRVPTSTEYNLKSEIIESSSFKISWKYNMVDSTWCPLTGFKFTFLDRWEQYEKLLPADTDDLLVTDLIPGRTYRMKVEAKIESGNAPASPILYVTTADDAPDEVRKLKALQEGKGELHIKWETPRSTGGTIRRYRVIYECVKLLACSQSCDHSKGELVVKSTSVVLTGLLSHAQYEIKVAGLAASLGPYKTVYATTDHTGASVAPDASEIPISLRTNISFVAHWQAPHDCSGLNGYLQGYRYELVTNSTDGSHILHAGSTVDTHVNFTDLAPHTHYLVKVYLVTSGGWSTSHKLVIPVTTTATTPEQVQGLTAYKRGRRFIGLRWSPPLVSYGDLKSFTVTHQEKNKPANTVITERMDPTFCSAWPQMYCHTITRLLPDVEYVMSVSARNMEVDNDGSPITINTITKEGAPGAPKSLRILNRSQHSLTVEWEIPDMLNGILRSFLVNVEETDSRIPTDCCEYFPIQELPVRSEEQIYHLEVSGLKPASTVTISVSAKTVTMGPTVNITTATLPDPPELTQPPVPFSMTTVADDRQQISVSVNPVEEVPGLKSTYLLLILPPKEEPQSLIWDAELSEKLSDLMNHTFYIVGEFHVEDIDTDTIPIGTGTQLINGTLGELQDPLLESGTYHTALALVYDYSGAKSVGVAVGGSFTVM